MKLKKLLLAAFAIALLAMLVPQAGAQEFFYGYYSLSAVCYAGGGDPYFTYTGTLKAAAPAGSTLHLLAYENGSLFRDETIHVAVDTYFETPESGMDFSPTTFPFTLVYYAEVIYNGEQVFLQTITIQATADGAPCLVTLSSTAGGGIFQDGRLCHWDNYAVYTTDETIDVYGIWQSEGYFVLRVTQEELDAHPGAEGVNTLIKSSGDGLVQVFRLGTSDTLQVHAGLDFVRFTGLPAGGVECGTIDLD